MFLSVRHLTIEFSTPQGTVRAVDDISMDIEREEIVGIAGESGSGKSMTALAIMGLLPEAARVTAGEIWYQPETDKAAVNLLALSPEASTKWRGRQVAMVFQNAGAALNPTMPCGEQVAEVLRYHFGMTKSTAKSAVMALFERVHIRETERVYHSYPFEISGGQQQRVLTALAVASKPALLIADEPTTALDPAAQESVLSLLTSLCREHRTALLIISHDPAVIFDQCDRIAVMYKGKKVEEGSGAQLQKSPVHPYTLALQLSRPQAACKVERLPDADSVLSGHRVLPRLISEEEEKQRLAYLKQTTPVLSVRDLTVRYVTERNFWGHATQWLYPVRHLSFEVHPQQTIGLVGRSGSGKSTLARAVAGMLPIFSGNLWWHTSEGNPVLLSAGLKNRSPLLRRQIHLIFQQPEMALDPRQTAGEAVEEGMIVHALYKNRKERREKVNELLEEVGLSGDLADRLPHTLSGGQRQRVCIARALSVEPRLLICDEVVSALDLTVQATILNLLKDVQAKFNFACLFISHDPGVIRHMCDEVIELEEPEDRLI